MCNTEWGIPTTFEEVANTPSPLTLTNASAQRYDAGWRYLFLVFSEGMRAPGDPWDLSLSNQKALFAAAVVVVAFLSILANSGLFRSLKLIADSAPQIADLNLSETGSEAMQGTTHKINQAGSFRGDKT